MNKINWVQWLHRWDEQQTGYIPLRELRFNVMFDVLEELLPPNFVAVDLCCGPGSISQRLLRRFPQAKCIAADLDPVLMKMGQSVLGDADGRLRWTEIDLTKDPDLAAVFEIEHVDAVLSTTALHWIPTKNLIHLYHQLGKLIRPNGVFLNGDHISFPSNQATLQQISNKMRDRTINTSFKNENNEDWEKWWQALAQEPGMKDLMAERDRRFAWRESNMKPPIYDLHVATLLDAGFNQVGTIWQIFDERILIAIR